jgi:cytochrome P450
MLNLVNLRSSSARPASPLTGGNRPPCHQNARRSLLPAFAPVAVDRLVPHTREICNELIDAILARNTGHYGTDKRGGEEENQVQR